MKKSLILLYLILFGCGGGDSTPPPTPIQKCDALISWLPPIQYGDGSVITLQDFKKYTIYMSNQESVKDTFIELVIDITDVNLISWELKQQLNPGKHWFYMTVTDNNDNTSAFSNIMTKECIS